MPDTMRPGTLFDSIRYKSFIGDRDRALEQVHQNAQTDISRMLFTELDKIENWVAYSVIHGGINVPVLHSLASSLDAYINVNFTDLFHKLVNRFKNLRRAVFTLTYAAEAEAIARATQRENRRVNWHKFKDELTNQIKAPTIGGQQLDKKIWHDLMKLKYKIITAYNLSLVQELPAPEVVAQVKASFPKIQTFKRPPRELKPIKEVAGDRREKNEVLSTDFINDDDWNLALQAYKDTELSPNRFDEGSTFDEEAGHMKYQWEVEQDLTDDFVNQVRSGQVEAANDLGIEEFVWVAVIDDKTCDDCCLPRNGKTTSEIEALMDSGELGEDDCEESIPPAHPNCRCQLAPVASTDQVEGPDWKSFNEWLES